MEVKKPSNRRLHIDEEVLKNADKATADRILLGESAQSFIEHPYWPHFVSVMEEVIVSLGDDLLHDPDTDERVKWYSKLLWDPKKHYLFCQIRRKMIKVLRAWVDNPMDYIVEAQNIVESLKEKPEFRR